MNVKHKFSSPPYVAAGFANLPDLAQLLETVAENIKNLQDVADRATLLEWLETFWQPQMQWVEKLNIDSTALLSRYTWPRRPLYVE